jgi:transcriptional regulator with XRE-family HTH domain
MAEETLDTLLDKLRPATLAEIAERCGLSLRALADLRAGRVSDPRRATVIALSVALKCKPSRVRLAIQTTHDAAQ